MNIPTIRCRAVLGAALLLFSAAAMAAPAQKPQQGGTLVYAISQGEPSTFDCQAAASISVMMRVSPHYSTLLTVDPEHYPKVVGDLAEKWKISPDGLTYEFKLQPKVKFHDGSDLTSADVKATFDRMRNPPAGVVSLRRESMKDVKAIETPDPKTVVFKLERPNPAMLQLLAMPFGCIYSAKLMAEDPSYPAKKVMGSGPFKFVNYVAGSEWVGERFKEYFKPGLPHLDGFRALSMTPAAAINAMTSGQVALDFRGVTRAEAARIVAARGDKVKVYEADPAISVLFLLAVNTQRPALADPRVRRALALAIDRWRGSKALEQSTTVTAIGGLSRPGSTFARSEQELQALPGFSKNTDAARAEARALLKEAGQSDLKLTFLNRRPWPAFGVFVVDQLRQIGVTVEHVAPEDSQFFSRRAAGNYDLVLDVMPDYMDDPTVQMYVFNSFDKNPSNTSRVNDAKVDYLFERQSRSANPKERAALVRDLEEYVVGQAYVLPLFWGRRTTVVASEMQGYVAAPTNYVGLDLSRYWLKK